MQVINLQGCWSLIEEKDGVRDGAVPIQLPGDNYSALFECGRIPDPYYQDNEKRVQGYRESTWVFERHFKVSRRLLATSRVELFLESVDTVAIIMINGHIVAESSNMFVPIRIDIRKWLCRGSNLIQVRCSPAHVEAAKRAKLFYEEKGFDIAAPISDNNRIPAMNFLRKVQCHAGWDWGPCLLVCGLYGALRIEAIEKARIVDVEVNTKRLEATWSVEVGARLDRDDVQQEVEVSFNDETKVLCLSGTQRVVASFEVSHASAKVWYPTGYGSQPRYTIKLVSPYEMVTRQIGLREIEVKREKDDVGESFTIAVNGIDVFCKGANWIPVDALPSRATPDVYKRILKDAQRANMNMVRVWGGGKWEDDVFYDTCDQLGLLIFHDCMFACMHYPATDAFAEDITREITYQIARLKHHPSIALWCGDNECFGLCAGGDEKPIPTLAENYFAFSKIVECAVSATDPDRLFWPSSPCNGKNSPPGSWHDDTTGDMHFWKVWHGSLPFEAYRTVRPRFCSEFGFQAFPTQAVCDAFCDGEGRTPSSEIMLCHQKNTGGNERIAKMFDHYFKPPQSFERFVYLSQLQQAMAIEIAVRYWRRTKPICMGTLYWQLNDNWPAVSWSSIDYSGNWKLLHYFAKRFYAPIVLSVFDEEDGMTTIWLTSDRQKIVHGMILIRQVTFEGETISEEFSCATVKPSESYLHCTLPFTRREDTFLQVQFNAGRDRCEVVHFFHPPKACPIRKPTIKMTYEDGAFYLSSDVPAFGVTITLPTLKPIVLEDNGFYLAPREKKRIKHDSVIPEDVLSNATVYSLGDDEEALDARN